ALTPRWAVLPMGFTSSLWIAQMINKAMVARSAPSLPGPPLQDCGPPLVARPGLAEEADKIGVSDWLRGWSDLVAQTDSSREGCAVARAFWPLGAAREAGRTSERQRYRRVGSRRARESAVETAGFRRQADGSWSVASGPDEWDCDEPPSEAARDWEIDKSFPEDVQLALRDRLDCSCQELGLFENDEQLGREPTPADVGESSSADDEARGGPGAARRAALKRTGHQRRRKFLDLALATAAPGTSTFLEQSSATPKVLGRCETEVGGFIGFAGGHPLVRDEQAGAALVGYFNILFFKGWGANKGEQVSAGSMRLAPAFSRAGGRQLPRAFRCLKGWRRRAPGRSRRSWPLAQWAGVAWRLVERGLLQMAVFLLISPSSYLRPIELMGLCRRGIIAPAAGVSPFWNLAAPPSHHAERSKTNLSDVSIAIDSPHLQLLGPTPRVLASGPREGSVWTFTHPQYLMEFTAALAGLEISEATVPRQTRHSGPSIDIARRYRNARSVGEREEGPT
ncbi:unnamed protein product, partial [Prorocentrum cordatum]